MKKKLLTSVLLLSLLSGCSRGAIDPTSTSTSPETTVFTLNTSAGSAGNIEPGETNLGQTEAETEVPDLEPVIPAGAINSGAPLFDYSITHERQPFKSKEDIFYEQPVNEDGKTRTIFPIRHEAFDQIGEQSPRNMEYLYLEYINTVNPNTIKVKYHSGGTDTQYNIEEGTELTFHLLGIQGYPNNEGFVPHSWEYTEQLLDETIMGGYLYGEVAYQVSDTELSGYLWYEVESDTIKLVQEFLLIEGYVEPDPLDVYSKYLNWFIQYPNLYPLES